MIRKTENVFALLWLSVMLMLTSVAAYEADRDKNCLEDEGCRFVMGLSCLVLVPLLICWNELRYVKLETLYAAAQRFVRDLDTKKSINVDGKFVCFSGRLSGETLLQDDMVPSVEAESSLLLKREIEILQYVQKKKGDDNYKLEEKWCKLPQVDPSHFKDKKNPTGNWEALAHPSRKLKTGRTWNKQNIEFGDNYVLFRASGPSIGSFAIPTALMDEAFLGTRHVHRLGELDLIKSSQGTWTPVRLNHLPNNGVVQVSRLPFTSCIKHDGFVYDGPKDKVGTIRMCWEYVAPQDMTIAAEAVAPGRPCSMGYGSATRNLAEPSAMLSMIREDLTEDLNSCLCVDGEEEKQGLLTPVNESTSPKQLEWTVTPFTVTKTGLLPPYRTKFLGKLWLYAPGNLNSFELLRKANRANSCCLWKVRGLSYVLLFIGWCLVFEPLANVFRATFLRSLLSFTFASVAFVLATVCCTSCTAIARIAARPVQSIMLISGIWAGTLFVLQRMDESDSNDLDSTCCRVMFTG